MFFSEVFPILKLNWINVLFETMTTYWTFKALILKLFPQMNYSEKQIGGRFLLELPVVYCTGFDQRSLSLPSSERLCV